MAYQVRRPRLVTCIKKMKNSELGMGISNTRIRTALYRLDRSLSHLNDRPAIHLKIFSLQSYSVQQQQARPETNFCFVQINLVAEKLYPGQGLRFSREDQGTGRRTLSLKVYANMILKINRMASRYKSIMILP